MSKLVVLVDELGRVEGLVASVIEGLHTVRGHFAHYTADAPLFGKYVGTWWRPWHVRGNPDHGVVVSDYKLDP